MIAISGCSELSSVTRQQSMKNKQVLATITAVMVMVLNLTVPVLAKASSIAQGYITSDKNLTTGMAVSLGEDSNSSVQTVVPATTSNSGKFVGILTTNNANLLTLTSSNATVVVATSGEAIAFVTDISGSVKKGDKLSISPVKGLLMKTEDNSASGVAAALEDAGVRPPNKQTIDLANGKKKEISIYSIEVSINQHIIPSSETSNKTFLKTLGQNISGKKVSDWQAVIALVVFILLLVVEAALIYGSVHSTFTALGRNPMAHDLVYKQLAQVILAVLAVLAFGIATIYAVLQI